MEKKKKLFSFKNTTTAVIFICWIVPLCIVLGVMSVSYKNGMIEKTEELMSEEVKTNAMNLSFQLNEVINLTNEIFYDRKLERAWMRYKNKELDDGSFYESGRSIITEKFENDYRIQTAFFYLLESPGQIYPQRSGELDYFAKENKDLYQQVSKLNNAKINIRVMDRQIYIIRNIYAVSGYEKFATLVLVLDMEELLEKMSDSNLYDQLFFIDENNSAVMLQEKMEEEELKMPILNKLEERYDTDKAGDFYILTTEKQDYMGFIFVNQEEDFRLCSVLIVDRRALLSGLEQVYSLIFGLLLVVFPIIGIFLSYFNRNVTAPVEALARASKEIKNGNMGITVEIDRNKIRNEEFTNLISSFNEMSEQIKYLFDYAYQEELARRDAQIFALQSQINPHFLNNTLEMMNWQARMAGDIDVSKMIEALSTLLDHSMNRNNKKFSTLAEEIRCADAYFYIISMRFGQRLQIEKQIDESILQVQVPSLILQPLLENAVVHGIDTAKRGTIWLNVYQKGKRIILQVLNTGKNMTSEDETRINNILSGKAQVQKGKGESNSLGIKNVNQRIQLIYGMNFGLTIRPYAEGVTAATIELPRNGIEEQD